MTYAIRRNNGDVIYFDAITNIEEQYTATVTKHPIASGAFISDHTIVDNIKFNLKAVLSDADFNLNRPSEEGWRSVTDKQFVNDTETKVPVQISNSGARWRSFLPEVVSQFTANTIPTVTVTAQSKVKTAHAVRIELISIFEQKEPFTLVEYNTNLIARSWPNTILTSLSFAEDADTGQGLFPVMMMEQVTFTDVENVKIKLKAPPNKGRQTGTTTKTPEKAGDNPAIAPTSNANKSASMKLTESASTFQ